MSHVPGEADGVSTDRRWPRIVAWCIVASVVPSAVWRSALGLGVDVGWSDAQLTSQDIPGAGTPYVFGLSAASVLLAALSFRLVDPNGDVVPELVPRLGGRRVPWPAVVAISTLGTASLIFIVVSSIVHWESVSGFADQPDTAAETLMIACYAPAAMWPVLLVPLIVDYGRRRARRSTSTPPGRPRRGATRR